MERALGDGAHVANTSTRVASERSVTVVKVFMNILRSSTAELPANHHAFFKTKVTLANLSPVTILVNLHAARAAVSPVVQPDRFWER